MALRWRTWRAEAPLLSKSSTDPPSRQNMNFGKTLLDRALRPNLRVKDGKCYSAKLLPKPLEPTPYTPPKRVPKPRTKRGQPPIALPRAVVPNQLPKKVSEKVKKIQKRIDEIAPYYAPEAITQFKKNLKFIQKAEITQKKQALKNNALNFEATIVNNNDPLIQFADTRGILKEKLKTLIREKRKGFKFNIILKVRLRKEREDGIIYKEPYFSSGTVTITNEDEVQQKLEVAEEEILERIAKCISEGSGWIIDEVLNHYINIVSSIPLRGNSYIPPPKELQNSKKGIINLKNEDNECFRWCQV